MAVLYSAEWVLPISSEPIRKGGVVVEGGSILAVGEQRVLETQFPEALNRDLGCAAILPGFVNTHSHLELTVMRGFLDDQEESFINWLKKLTFARLEKLTADDLLVSASWGACEAARAGVTCLGDSSDTAEATMRALCEVGLRGIVFQESFGPDPNLVKQNFDSLRVKVEKLRELETDIVRAGVSPHAPYTVCAPQLELTADFALRERLPVMMHAAESIAEEQLLREGRGLFAEGLSRRNIEWKAPGISTIQYLQRHRILETRPLLAHCINVDAVDIETLYERDCAVAHCPRSNAKLGHRRAPLSSFLKRGVTVGLGTDSVASNNSCDMLAEARFAVLAARTASNDVEPKFLRSDEGLALATIGGARALKIDDRVGELKKGFQADFIAITLSSAHQIPSYDPNVTIMFSSSGSDVVLTVVAGREVYVDGRVQNVDEERLRGRMLEIAQKLA